MSPPRIFLTMLFAASAVGAAVFLACLQLGLGNDASIMIALLFTLPICLLGANRINRAAEEAERQAKENGHRPSAAVH